MRRRSVAGWGVVSMYACTHAAVDAGCAVLLWSAFRDGRLTASMAWSAFLIYNLLAFAVQPLVGLAADRFRLGRGAAVAGALLTAAALALAFVPGAVWHAVAVAGVGNAVFHIGGGIVSLRAAARRAGPAGVFVAPGAAGLAAGIVAGKAGGPAWPFAVALLALAVVLATLRPPVLPSAPAGDRREPLPAPLTAAGVTALLLVLAVVGVRSFVGMTLVLPWKAEPALLAALTAAVVAGKAGGGLLADRFGWRPVAVTALLVSLPLLALGAALPAAGIAGSLALNMTMPVTLAAVAALLPRGSEGFAFGLTCLALFAGAAPALGGLRVAVSPLELAALVLPATAALWFTLGGTRSGRDRDEAPSGTAPQGGWT